MLPKNYFYQFMYSAEKKPVQLMGAVSQSGAAGSAATLTANGITYTADVFGAAGNSITIALVAGGTAGAEVVTVSGKSISVQIESGVSTRTQVKTALDASSAAAALIDVSVTSGATAATLQAATALATGVDTVFVNDGKYFDMVQLNTGLYQIQIPANSGVAQFKSLLKCNVMLQKAAATDLITQIAAVDLAAGTINFRVLAGATPTNLANGDIAYIDLCLRQSTKW